VVAVGVALQGCGASTISSTGPPSGGTTGAATSSAPASHTAASTATVSSAATSTAAASPASTAPDASTAAVQLASYQENSQSDGHDALALSFQRSLDALKPLCRESSYRVAAESWATWKDLLKNGVNVPLLHVVHALQTVGSGLPSNARPTDCAALLAAYDVEVESGSGKP
jgi:hypothetical protein